MTNLTEPVVVITIYDLVKCIKLGYDEIVFVAHYPIPEEHGTLHDVLTELSTKTNDVLECVGNCLDGGGNGGHHVFAGCKIHFYRDTTPVVLVGAPFMCEFLSKDKAEAWARTLGTYLIDGGTE